MTDSVMGGISEAEVRVSGEKAIIFSGTVSLENRGGFASVRTRKVRVDLSGYRGLLLRVFGDENLYTVNLHTNIRIPGGSYRAEFETLGYTWQEIFLSFSDFRPVAFGRSLRQFPQFNPSEVRSFGLMIASGQEGPFRLEVARIRTVA